MIITDEGSLINGKPFEYMFARKNRAPALNYIRQDTFSFSGNYQINQADIIREPLRASDPDEDNYSFNILIGESGNIPAQFPRKLSIPQIKFRVEVSDGQLRDYQIITVNRI